MFKFYSLYDVKVSTFGNPFCAQSDGAAVRMVIDAASDPNTMLYKHPADFILYFLGTFDEDTGEVAGSKLNNLGTVAALTTKEPSHVS